MNGRVWRAKYYVFERKDFADCESTKKLRISVAISQFFVIEQGGLRKKKLRIRFFPN